MERVLLEKKIAFLVERLKKVGVYNIMLKRNKNNSGLLYAGTIKLGLAYLFGLFFILLKI